MTAIWKTVRVFISSTFRDMQSERDWLVRFVFPKLRQELGFACATDLKHGLAETLQWYRDQRWL